MLFDVGGVFGAEVAQGRQHRVGRGLAQAAERRLVHRVAQAAQAVQVLDLAAPLGERRQHVEHLARADAAGNTLAARLVLREGQEVAGDVHHAGRLVGHDHAARAHDGARGLEILVVDARVEQRLRDAAARRPAQLYGLEGLAVATAAADVVDHLAQRHADGDLHQARVLHCAGQGKGLGAAAACRAHAAEPLRPVEQDRRHAGVGLHVVDVRRVAPQPVLGGVGRAHGGHAAVALDGAHERGLLAADKGAGALLDHEVEVQTAAQDVLADDAVGARLVDGLMQRLDRQRVLGADVDIAAAGADGARRDQHAFEQAVRVALDHGAIHKGAGVALVGVADEELHAAGLLVADLPLGAGGEAGAAAPAQPCVLDGLDDFVGRHGQGQAQRLVAVVGEIIVERMRVDDAAELRRYLDLAAEKGVILAVGLAAHGPIGGGGGWLTEVAVEQRVDGRRLDRAVEDRLVALDDLDERLAVTGADTAGALHGGSDAARADRLLQRVVGGLRAGGQPAGGHADADDGLHAPSPFSASSSAPRACKASAGVMRP